MSPPGGAERASTECLSPQGAWMGPDPTLQEERRRVWRMSAEERVAAMRSGRLTLTQCCHWASHRPHEVPLLNGEFEFIAVLTPEIAELDERPPQTPGGLSRTRQRRA